MEKNNKKINTTDQILQLPENLVHRILSSLPLKDLVRSSILSKRWEKIWIVAFTVLEFDSKLFRGMKSSKKTNAKIEELMDFLERTLRSRYVLMISIENLVLNPPFHNSKTSTFMDRYISYAIGCNVKTLDVGFKNYSKVPYKLPQTVFVSRSITELRLTGCKLEWSSLSCPNMNMPSLKSLSLLRVCFDDKTIQNLITSCTVIERLDVQSCHSTNGTLKFFGLVNPNLFMVRIARCDFQRVEIEALGLQTFRFVDRFVWKSPCEINVSACENLRVLTLYQSTIIDKRLSDNLSKLCLLETLTLSECNYLESIKISNRRLKNLTVRMCRKLVKLEIRDLDLSWFSFMGRDVVSLSSDALTLLRADIYLHPRNVGTAWYAKLTKFLGKLNNIKYLKLYTRYEEDVIVPKEFRNGCLLPPLYNVKYLTLELCGKQWSQEVEGIMDGLLWFSPHPVTLSIISRMKKRRAHFKLRFLYEERNGDQNPCGCYSLPIKCWRHALKEVMIESSDEVEDEDKKSVRSFFEHAKVLNKITVLTSEYVLRNL